MFGQWRGGTFDDRDIGNFYGKRFNSEEHCEPMLRTKEDGTVFAWPDWGEARLREVGYGGKVQSTVIYDDRPLMDYFCKVNADLVLGRSEEHTSELQSLMRISYAVFCLQQKILHHSPYDQHTLE